MMRFVYSIIVLYLINFSTWACPACAGSMTNESDKYIVIALGVFILFTYIPFYILYSTIIKHRDVNRDKQGNR